MRGLGTVINVAAVLAGSAVGLAIGERLPARIRQTMLQGLGLVTIAVAITGLEPLYDPDEGLRRFIIVLGAITVGGVLGELLRLEDRVENVGRRLQMRFGVVHDDMPSSRSDDEVITLANPEEAAPVAAGHSRFVEGFVIASTVFCVGPLTILGAIEDGLGISVRLLAIKSALDGIASIGFAAAYRWGVVASVGFVALYQGGLTAGASLVEPLFTDEVVAVLGATGSLLVLAIGLKLLDLVHVRVVNLLPAVLLGPLAAGLLDLL